MRVSLWVIRLEVERCLTGDGQVGVGLDLAGPVAGEALEHSRVVRQQAVDLQAATHQDPVAGGLHWTYECGVLIPHDISLRGSWVEEKREAVLKARKPAETHTHKHRRQCM